MFLMTTTSFSFFLKKIVLFLKKNNVLSIEQFGARQKKRVK